MPASWPHLFSLRLNVLERERDGSLPDGQACKAAEAGFLDPEPGGVRPSHTAIATASVRFTGRELQASAGAVPQSSHLKTATQTSPPGKSRALGPLVPGRARLGSCPGDLFSWMMLQTPGAGHTCEHLLWAAQPCSSLSRLQNCSRPRA